MSRKDRDKKKKKVETRRERPVQPLNAGVFGALDSLDAGSLAPSPPEPEKKKPEPRPAKAKPAQRQPAEPATPKRFHAIPENSRGRVVLRREKKGRGGKTVVVISGFAELPEFNAVEVLNLAKKLRGQLGCGGSADRHEILLQGDRPADVAAALRELGFRVEGVTS